MRRSLALVFAVAVGCKIRGQAEISLVFPESLVCTPFEDTEVSAYILANAAACNSCQCGACFDSCQTDNCVEGCGGGTCTLDDLARGISIEPPSGGLYTVIFDFSRVDELGVRRLIASACAEVVVEDDGTEDKVATAVGVCCGS